MIQETKSMKEQGLIGYRFVDNYESFLYELVDFSTNEILDKMPEIAIVYDGDVLLKHGHPDKVLPLYNESRQAYKKFGIDKELGYIMGKFEIDELDKILSISDYIGKFIKANTK